MLNQKYGHLMATGELIVGFLCAAIYLVAVCSVYVEQDDQCIRNDIQCSRILQWKELEEVADMNYITFNEMIEVNGLLEEKGLNFKVHLRDACGKEY